MVDTGCADAYTNVYAAVTTTTHRNQAFSCRRPPVESRCAPMPLGEADIGRGRRRQRYRGALDCKRIAKRGTYSFLR